MLQEISRFHQCMTKYWLQISMSGRVSWKWLVLKFYLLVVCWFNRTRLSNVRPPITLLISLLSLSVISVFFCLRSCPIIDMMSWPPCGLEVLISNKESPCGLDLDWIRYKAIWDTLWSRQKPSQSSDKYQVKITESHSSLRWKPDPQEKRNKIGSSLSF